MFKVTAAGLAAVLALAAAGTASAQATTYTYVGATNVAFNDFTVCEAGPCANFTNAMRLQGSFTTSAPLAAGLTNASIVPILTDFSFNNGLQTISRSDPNVVLEGATVSTDGSGAITSFGMGAHRWRTSVHTADTTAPFDDPNSKLDRFFIESGGTGARGAYNLTCLTLGIRSSGEAGCVTFVILGTDRGASNGTAPYVPFAAGALVAVPTMSEWALILMGLMLACFAAFRLRRLA